ncbi:hypothetical protein Y032_0007g3298 [Ancylostoma ceylanicum]|uniref:Uncharacterized protein n=1 Tax=Ancylostoma ceylanicum TaxID=53326 RepID=A0A016VPC9_9BILA|nr:hypothetical protein Y032_0007g3298 [Ancylostoma ceylanicum]
MMFVGFPQGKGELRSTYSVFCAQTRFVPNSIPGWHTGSLLPPIASYRSPGVLHPSRATKTIAKDEQREEEGRDDRLCHFQELHNRRTK